MGYIVLLNGTSSAGKTSIAKALQRMMDAPYLLVGIDTFVFALPKQYLNAPLWHEVYEYLWSEDGSLTIKTGPLGYQLMSGMHRSIAALARTGFNIIVDHVLLDRRPLMECVDVLSDFDVLFVGVRCPLEVVEQRERERKDRTLGQARAQYHVVHSHAIYDLEVDTSVLSPEECALRIKQRLEDGVAPTVFKQLKSN
jgi:chloramphenicol 3-O phosphotransferase